MSSEYDEIGENSYFQISQQILNDLQRQHQHQPMFHFNYGRPHLSMEKHRQATPQQPPTNYSEMLHQFNDSNSRPSSRCSTQSFASNKLEAGESSSTVPSSFSTQKVVQRGRRKGVRYERDWLSEETAQLTDLRCSSPVLYKKRKAKK